MKRPVHIAAEILATEDPMAALLQSLELDLDGIKCVMGTVHDRTHEDSLTASEHAHIAGILPEMAARFDGYLRAMRALSDH